MLPTLFVSRQELLPDTEQWQNRFTINSETSNRLYTIAQHKNKKHWGCSCPGWKRYRYCKHLTALGIPGNEQPFEVNLIKNQTMAKRFLDGYKTYDTSKGFGNTKQWQKAFFGRMSKEQAEMILQDRPETPYSILGIKEGATKSAIKTAFRKLITEWHPDKNQHRIVEAGEISKKLIAAYTILTAD
jgi:hypothetical protein